MKNPTCEFCRYAVRGQHYSLSDCNKTGRGVVLHGRCAIGVKRIANAYGVRADDVLSAASTPAFDKGLVYAP